MNFNQALKALKKGNKIKLPSWGGYWELENDNVMMHTKDGKVLDIRETENILYTLSNIASDEWLVADEKNTPILGGKISLTFAQALKYIRKGKMMRRQVWGKDAHVQEISGVLITQGLPLVNAISAEDMVSADWEFYN